uniref:Death-associated protein kinase 1 (Trinotate prediction) n=1 Tax=Henneguya salminicola TaxID=69463 RepID=A0A6G3MKQ3_HENSL
MLSGCFLNKSEIFMASDQKQVVNSPNLSNKYEVLEELGSGMHANVFRGKNITTGDFFALKMAKKTRLRTKREEHNRALSNEASIIKNLNHINIVKCFEAFEHSAQIVVVLELFLRLY